MSDYDFGPTFLTNANNVSQSMTLRDFFAGQAISGLMSNCKVPDAESIPRIANKAYQMADAMLAERETK